MEFIKEFIRIMFMLLIINLLVYISYATIVFVIALIFLIVLKLIGWIFGMPLLLHIFRL